jgi:hypothetical protein
MRVHTRLCMYVCMYQCMYVYKYVRRMFCDFKAKIQASVLPVIWTKYLINYFSSLHRYKVTYYSLMQHWMKNFFSTLVNIDVLKVYKLQVSRPFKVPIVTMCACRHFYVIGWRHCTPPKSFQVPMAASLDWSLPSGVALWHSHDFMEPHIKKSKEFNSVGQVGQSTVPYLAIHLASQLSFKIPLLLCQNMEVRRRAAATFRSNVGSGASPNCRYN